MKKTQKEMKRYADINRKETEEWKKEDRVILSIKDLVFKERPVCKLVERYVRPYEIEKVVSLNLVIVVLLHSMILLSLSHMVSHIFLKTCILVSL